MKLFSSLTILVCLCAYVQALPKQSCRCSTAEEIGVWCEACGVGHVAAVRIESRPLFDAIDAHGHSVRPESFRCEECKKAFKLDAFCAHCKMGFVRGKAYFSRLTYTLARGQLVKPEAAKCAPCRRRTGPTGWCDECNAGFVGNVRFRDRDRFDEALELRAVLQKAIEKLSECASCAIAMAVDRRCRKCGKTYDRGKLIHAPSAPVPKER